MQEAALGRVDQEKLRVLKPRRIDALFRRLDDELLVYDSLRCRGHSLNKTAARVWLACDGKTSLGELIEGQGSGGMTERTVWLALRRLQRARLLEPDSIQMDILRKTRRDALRKLGIAAGMMAPLVTSLVIPPAAAAASCFALLHSCTTNAQCCSGHCGLSGVKLVCLP